MLVFSQVTAALLLSWGHTGRYRLRHAGLWRWVGAGDTGPGTTRAFHTLHFCATRTSPAPCGHFAGAETQVAQSQLRG